MMTMPGIQSQRLEYRHIIALSIDGSYCCEQWRFDNGRRYVLLVGWMKAIRCHIFHFLEGRHEAHIIALSSMGGHREPSPDLEFFKTCDSKSMSYDAQ